MEPAPYDKRKFDEKDIRRYFEGLMDKQERYNLEKAALEDPFLADAMEGFEKATAEERSGDLEDLRSQLSKRVEQRRAAVIPMRKWHWAAALIFLILMAAGASYIIWIQKPSTTTLVKREEKSKAFEPAQPKSPDTALPGEPVEKYGEGEKTAVAQAEAERIKKEDNNAKVNASKKEETDKNIPEEKKQITATESTPPPNALKDTIKRNPRINEPVLVPIPRAAQANKGVEQGVSRGKQGPVYYFKGQVMNQNQEPIAFANLSLYQGKSYRYTDAKGFFNIIAGDSSISLDVKAAGYETFSKPLSYREEFTRIILTTVQDQKPEKSAAQPFPGQKTGDEETVDTEKPFSEPADGWAAYNSYLLNNLRLPDYVRRQNIQGMVELSFLVDSTGRCSDFRVEKSLCPPCDKEAVRLIREGPRWEIFNTNKPVRTRLTVLF